MKRLLNIWILLFLLAPLQAQQETTRILFLLDASASMQQDWGGVTKMSLAKKVLGELADSLDDIPNVEMGLRVFGSISSNVDKNCRDTKLEAPIRPNNSSYLKQRLESVRPRGITPIAYTLERVERDFLSSNGRNVVILITDGIESCDGDPCAVSLALQKKGIMLKPFIIGLGNTKELADAFECVGKFFDASKKETFKQILNNVVSQVLGGTTVTVELLDKFGKPTETNVPLSFYDAFSDVERYQFVHTLNSRGLPDTLTIDPVNSYDLIVHTTPAINLNDIELKAGKHNVISVKAAQGNLFLQLVGLTGYPELKCIVREAGKREILFVQDFGTKTTFLAGTYDLEIMTLPPMNVNNIEITANFTKTVNIPAPGLLTILNSDAVPVIGSVFEEKGNDLHWVTDIRGDISSETLTLQPGVYRLVYRNKGSRKSVSTREVSFKILTGGSETIKM